jgi:hypothetical protein
VFSDSLTDNLHHLAGGKPERLPMNTSKGKPSIQGGVHQTPRIKCSRKSAKRRAPAKHPLLISDPEISIPRYVNRENATESLLTNSAVRII